MAPIHGYAARVSVGTVRGGPAVTDLNCPGVEVGDDIIAARLVPADGGLATNVDVSAQVSVTAYQTIQLSTTDSSGSYIVVTFQRIP